jgi:hypothetical protein
MERPFVDFLVMICRHSRCASENLICAPPDPAGEAGEKAIWAKGYRVP